MVWRGAVLGALGGLALTAAAVAADWPAHTPRLDRSPPDSVTHRAAAKAFAEAWRRSLEGTWYVTFDFTRTLADGRTLRTPGTSVQRPPDRLTVQFGSLTGRLGGRLIDCVPTTSGNQCLGDVALPYDAEIERDMKRIVSYVGGPLPIYRVDRDGRRCFRLTRQIEFMSPPYGDRARFCFDETTGAISDVEIVRPQATDTQTATSVRPEVFDSDLELPRVG